MSILAHGQAGFWVELWRKICQRVKTLQSKEESKNKDFQVL